MSGLLIVVGASGGNDKIAISVSDRVDVAMSHGTFKDRIEEDIALEKH